MRPKSKPASSANARPKTPFARQEGGASPSRGDEGAVKRRTTWLAVSLGDGSAPLGARVQRLRAWADAVELRLDLLPLAEVEAVLERPPLPVIVTHRPQREGGKYTGPENTRLALLRHMATDYQVAAVDIEWDAVDDLGAVPVPRIVSRHFLRHTPINVYTHWRFLANFGGEIIKLATYAHSLVDALRIILLFRLVDRPTIAIAMGEAGQLTRLIPPFFPSAYLTYAAEGEKGVAPGQLPIRVMREHYHVHRLRPDTELLGYLDPEANHSPLLARLNQRWAQAGHNRIILPLAPTPKDDLPEVVSRAWDLGFKRLWVTASLAEAMGLGKGRDVWLYPENRVEVIDGEQGQKGGE